MRKDTVLIGDEIAVEQRHAIDDSNASANGGAGPAAAWSCRHQGRAGRERAIRERNVVGAAAITIDILECRGSDIFLAEATAIEGNVIKCGSACSSVSSDIDGVCIGSTKIDEADYCWTASSAADDRMTERSNIISHRIIAAIACRKGAPAWSVSVPNAIAGLTGPHTSVCSGGRRTGSITSGRSDSCCSGSCRTSA